MGTLVMTNPLSSNQMETRYNKPHFELVNETKTQNRLLMLKKKKQHITKKEREICFLQ